MKAKAGDVRRAAVCASARRVAAAVRNVANVNTINTNRVAFMRPAGHGDCLLADAGPFPLCADIHAVFATFNERRLAWLRRRSLDMRVFGPSRRRVQDAFA